MRPSTLEQALPPAMQYFGSFGSPWCFLIPAFIFVWTICYCISNYRTGATVHFDNPNDVFVYYNGPVLGRILDIVVNVCLALTSLVMFAGAGATVPLTGFGNTLAKGVREAVKEQGILGALTGGLKASAAGIAAAVFFGFLAALLCNPKDKS